MKDETVRRNLFNSSVMTDWDMDAVDFARDGDGYLSPEMDAAWWGFNAALDAVVIQCPTTYSREYNRSERSYNEGVSDFKEAVESVGLGLKVIIQ